MSFKTEAIYSVKELIGDGRLRMWKNHDMCEEGLRLHGSQFEAISDKPKNILTCCPNYCNIGDHAIAVAERRILLSSSECPCLSFEDDPTTILSCLQKYCTPDDVIYLQGGGNMGTLYRKEEDYRLRLISLMKHNRIVLFPQTMSYEDSESSQRYLKHTQKIYNSHPDLHLFAREKVSYERMKEAYPNCDVQLVPDIVLSVQGEDNASFGQRSGVLLCMRNDVEKVSDDVAHRRLEEVAASVSDQWRYTDTTISDDNYPVSREFGEQLVADKWAEFKKARLVITDRLHGMIFSAITGTPCVALNNANGKVGFEYEWLKNVPYIAFANTVEEVPQLVDQVMKVTDPRFPGDWFAEQFASLTRLIP